MISGHRGPSHGLAPTGSRPRRVVPIRAGHQEESSPFFTGIARLELTQINLLWPPSFIHKIDLIVRFRFAGVRIRGHKEG
jgi:hypothetical protein